MRRDLGTRNQLVFSVAETMFFVIFEGRGRTWGLKNVSPSLTIDKFFVAGAAIAHAFHRTGTLPPAFPLSFLRYALSRLAISMDGMLIFQDLLGRGHTLTKEDIIDAEHWLCPYFPLFEDPANAEKTLDEFSDIRVSLYEHDTRDSVRASPFTLC
jgi:hypothetical protein